MENVPATSTDTPGWNESNVGVSFPEKSSRENEVVKEPNSTGRTPNFQEEAVPVIIEPSGRNAQ